MWALMWAKISVLAAWVWATIKRQPVILITSTTAILGYLGTFGFHVPDNQAKLIISIATIAAGLISHLLVTPNVSVDAKVQAAIAAQPPAGAIPT